VSLDKQWDVIADRPALEAAVLFVHNPSDLIVLYVRVDASQSLRHLVDDLLFAQLDHENRLRGLYGLVNRRW
jgi:hypothetical protein